MKKPKNISFAQGAALPLVGLTAWQSLFDAVSLKKGETVLIQGGSGGVGSMGVQFAKNIGARVITTARPTKHEYVKNLGADLVLDYKGNIVEDIKTITEGGVDVVFDCVGGDSFTKGLSCLKRGGRIVSILEHMDAAEASSRGITASYVFVHPSGKDLQSIVTLIEQNKIVPPHIEELLLQDAALAQEKLRTGNAFGKIVLHVA